MPNLHGNEHHTVCACNEHISLASSLPFKFETSYSLEIVVEYTIYFIFQLFKNSVHDRWIDTVIYHDKYLLNYREDTRYCNEQYRAIFFKKNGTNKAQIA